MKRRFILLTMLLSIGISYSQQLAFPGADGYGKYVTGGRGGNVYEVTNLNDDYNAGSLRYAINQSGARTIVFRVSGNIELKSDLNISNGDLTIAGQTAPGEGICIKNYPVEINANNVIIRYVRFRLNEDWGEDALGGNSSKNSASSGSLPRKNIIIDHCSVSYGCDETLSAYDIENLTIQWCIISESMNRDGHGYGGIFGGWGASLHHTLFAHHKNRSPRFCGARYQNNLEREVVDMRYNVIYNAGKSYGGEGGNYNLINNYYKKLSGEFCNPYKPDADQFVGMPYDSIKSHWYVDGNYVYGNTRINADNWNGGVKLNYPALNIKVETPFPSAYIGAEETATEAYYNVCYGAGVTLPKRDTVDKRVINSVIKNIGSVPLTLADIPGEPFPVLDSLPAPADSDHDGMPDEWENANNLDPNNADDRNTVATDGYTMLEKYMNSIEFTNKVEGINVIAMADSMIQISWAETFLGEDGYIIERAISGQAFSLLDTVSANTCIFIDSSANAINNYEYRIKAYNAYNESQYSEETLYSPVYYNLTISLSGQGTITPESGSYLSGTKVTLTANTDTGWEFVKWSGDASGTDNSIEITMDSDKDIIANFSELVSIKNNDLYSKYRIYPNPVTDKLEIELYNKFSQGAVIQLFDNTGRLILTKKVQESKHIIDIGNLYPGIYIIKISNINKETIIKRIAKQ